jgi:hypothetical protein
MTGWDILDTIIKASPPLAATVLFVVATVIFIIGFSKHGINFLKYGFKQMVLDASLEKRFDDLGARIDGLHTEIDGLHTELETIKVNHFGHLKNFLTELTSILLDKSVINNENKARLDNQLRGM